jgi:hypothetical protein
VLRIRIQDEFFPDYKSLIQNGIRDLRMFFQDVLDPEYGMEKIRIRDKHPRTTRLLNTRKYIQILIFSILDPDPGVKKALDLRSGSANTGLFTQGVFSRTPNGTKYHFLQYC